MEDSLISGKSGIMGMRGIMTTIENDDRGGGSQLITDPETRMTIQFNGSNNNRETLGFDNKPFDFGDDSKQKQQVIKIK